MSKKSNRRLRRLERHQQLRKASPLNLVSLMDIFTILVFFLLVNSSNSQQLPSQKDLKLPTSTTQKAPRETIVLAITPESLLLQGQEVAKVQDWIGNEAKIIEPLQKELRFYADNRQVNAALPADQGRAITIMGDENIPYELLRKILATCQQVNYTDIVFAANQVAKPKS